MDEKSDTASPNTGIFRAMTEENGMPKLGVSATTLGVRALKDIVTDSSGLVHRPLFLPGSPNGLSCAPTIQSLPRFALPLAWGGINKATSVWAIEDHELGPDLIAAEDGYPGARRHISIGPARTMLYHEYVKAIETTQTKWRKVVKP